MIVLLLICCLVLYLLFPKHSKDTYTSAQPPPPFSTQVSTNIVYPDNAQIRRPILGLDCANDHCPDPYDDPYDGYDPYHVPQPYGHYKRNGHYGRVWPVRI